MRIKARRRPRSVSQIAYNARNLLMRGDTDEALLLLAKAMRSKPDDAWILHVLGESHALAGHFTEAIDNLNRATTIDPGNAHYRLSLAEALMFHKPAEAIPHFRSAIQMGVSPPPLFRICPGLS